MYICELCHSIETVNNTLKYYYDDSGCMYVLCEHCARSLNNEKLSFYVKRPRR